MIKTILTFLGLHQSFSKRINKTLGVFTVAQNELISINTEMQKEIGANIKKMAELDTENRTYIASKATNQAIIENLKSILGGK